MLSADGHDPIAIKAAIDAAKAETNRPTLISCKTIIGFGSPNKQGTAATHGAPLGDDEVAAVPASRKRREVTVKACRKVVEASQSVFGALW